MKPIPDDYKLEPKAFALKDTFEIDRWMCDNCGLIFDYQFDAGELGWPKLDAQFWVDGEEVEHLEEEFWCPRCGIDLKEKPLVPVTVYPDSMKDEIKSLRLQLKYHFLTLNYYKEQRAKRGALDINSALHIAITETEANITEIEEKLKLLTKRE